MNNRLAYIVFLLFFPVLLFAQTAGMIKGTITNENNEPVADMHISIKELPDKIIKTKNDGSFNLTLPANNSFTLIFTHVNYIPISVTVSLKPGQILILNKKVQKNIINFKDFVIEEEVDKRTTNMQRLDPKIAVTIPNPSGQFETILKTYPGVSSNNELSSQYSVRGGNFDENLVYVNDIQIYRPFLIRSGQQEGLSFINGKMVESVYFSAGGFEAKYGDKMSSVLDVKYKDPIDNEGSVSFSLQGADVFLAGSSNNYRFTYNTGIRYQTNQYVLSSLNTKGSYRPNFTDIQTYLTYDVTEKWEIAFLGNYARNSYKFIPQTRETEFGTINQALKLTIAFEGQEVDKFNTYFGAISNTFRPKQNVKLSFIASAYKSLEDETFDIYGGYRIDELERDLSKDNFGDVKFNRGIGLFLNHGRNYLDATVINVQHKGQKLDKTKSTWWGFLAQSEHIDDKINQWDMIDSAGYSIPHPQDSVGYTNSSAQPYQYLNLYQTFRTATTVSSFRYTGYGQREYRWMRDSVKYTFNGGVRFNYWTLNKQLLVSPRAMVSMLPNWQHNVMFRFATGVYYQPPFYKEFRDFNGNTNLNIKAQRSLHFIFGTDYEFKAWGRPFKFIGELYYKYMDNVIPYEVDNVRIRYYGTNNAVAYATGVDLKINGEFVKGTESWLSVSVMQTKENLLDDEYYIYLNSDGDTIISGYTVNNVPADSIHITPGWIPRPTDQRVNVGLYFSDYFPNNPNLKMHLTLFFGTGLPFGPPNNHERYKAVLRMPPYRRVDIGFSYLIKDAKKEMKRNNVFGYFKNIWIQAQIFNLLQINNTISYLWVEDFTGRQYAVPNYLTSRQLNVKMTFEF
jgi:hypothetical protein